MKLNASKIKTMIVSRSRKIHPQSTALALEFGCFVIIVLNESDYLDILDVIFDAKMTFEKHLRSYRGLVSWESPGKNFTIDRSFWDIFGVLSSLSWSIFQQCLAQLPIHVHCKLLDRVVMSGSFLSGCVMPPLQSCNLAHLLPPCLYSL